jgi:hypothetical protein
MIYSNYFIILSYFIFRYMMAMNANIKRIAMQPITRQYVRPASPSVPQGTEGGRAAVLRPQGAKLSKYPKTLYVLWQEYEFGLEGNKPAKMYTPAERGANKCSYCRRKVFWDAIETLMQRGASSDVAIDTVYQRYGRDKSNSKILKEMGINKRVGISVV